MGCFIATYWQRSKQPVAWLKALRHPKNQQRTALNRSDSCNAVLILGSTPDRRRSGLDPLYDAGKRTSHLKIYLLVILISQ